MNVSTKGRLPPDLHTHNARCGHAQGTILEYARAAEAAGVAALACTDHLPTDDGFGLDSRMPLSEFPEYVAEVERVRGEVAVPVLLGVEADYYRGCERFLEQVSGEYGFDVILGSVHFRDYWSDRPEARGLADHEDPEGVWRVYFGLVKEMAQTGLYDVVGHLDLPKKFGMPKEEGMLRSYAEPALDAIAEAGMAIEINTSGGIHKVREFYPTRWLLTLAFERGIPLALGSDSHVPSRVGDGFVEAMELARGVGYRSAAMYRGRVRSEVRFPEG
ncbi:MAG TPA: histidinol-phosphatase HisJ family protein [Kiritimatiellia bacterium]|nr:histidinol-phosphatase HisJ family protein [Kiritimatiellia bacterium]